MAEHISDHNPIHARPTQFVDPCLSHLPLFVRKIQVPVNHFAEVAHASKSWRDYCGLILQTALKVTPTMEH